MSEVSPSRRKLLKAGVAAVVTVSTPLTIAAQAPLPTASEVERDLGHPLPDEAKELLKAALESNRNNAKERLKTPLPDCSEPCFVYRPSAIKGGR